jgi:hypothetical protein
MIIIIIMAYFLMADGSYRTAPFDILRATWRWRALPPDGAIPDSLEALPHVSLDRPGSTTTPHNRRAFAPISLSEMAHLDARSRSRGVPPVPASMIRVMVS